ncbi:unnamed protein product [Ambrosiozyma monospora]|uniref:Unnamed protein product n=1 Tax=Ambrosiozyma monospora TaxID=43982 RepID=A0A9W6YZN5_AMBMO|nr:unnamed protein product [Ambrosiozyma monospora]
MYVSKRGNPDLMGRNPFLLAIQDPHDSSNNISRGTFNLRDVKRSFGGAFQLLVNKCYDMSTATYKQRLGQSILGDIIKFKGKKRTFEDARGEVLNKAYEVASGRAQSPSGLPLLPSEKAGLDPDEYEYTVISDSDSEDDIQIAKTFEKSQSSKKSKKSKKDKKSKKSGDIDELLGLENTEKKEPELTFVNSTKTAEQNAEDEADYVDSDESDYDPAASLKKSTSSSSLDKNKKREYWQQKSGNTF